ncbi:hypothetical protein LTR87_016409 [Friedmanniomyces endolithicus]|nr:hypothetical protein LTR87_016409 [Friedmanniomyces endolithicus]
MAVFTASAFLSLLLQTYVWQQYKFQAASCLNSPTLTTDCSQIFPCSNIPSIASIYPVTNGAYGYHDFEYYYTDIKSWGYGRSNLTTLQPRFANMSAQATYSVCAANQTCYAYYQRNPKAANKAILGMTTANLNRIIALLPEDNSKVWYPNTLYANAMSVYTVLPPYDSEVYGSHNAVVLATQQGTINATKYGKALQLSVLLSGGASMYESLINTVVLANHKCDSSIGFKKTRAVTDTPAAVDVFDIGLTAKMADLERFSSYRGQERAQVWSMSMSRYKSVMQKHASLQKRNCSSSAQIQFANTALAAAGTVCAAVQGAKGVWSVSGDLATIATSVFMDLRALESSASAAYGVENVIISIVSFACSFADGKGLCYPSTTASFDAGTPQSFALTALVIAADIATGDVPGTAIDVHGCWDTLCLDERSLLSGQV